MNEISTNEIDPKSLYGITYYEYGEAYYGSCGPIRFRVARNPLENVHFIPADKRGECTLRAVVWPSPFSFAATPDKEKEYRDFPFTQEGLSEAADWISGAVRRAQEERT